MGLLPPIAADEQTAVSNFTPHRVGRHELYLGRSQDVLPYAVELCSVDVVVTSPPYNLGIAYNTHKDDMSEAEYLDWFAGVVRMIAALLRPDGSFFLNIGASSTQPWLAFSLPMMLRRLHDPLGRPLFQLQNHIVWTKSVTVDGVTTGQFKPINSKRFLNHTHETILHLTRTGKVELDRLAVGVEYGDKSNIARFGASGRPDKRCRGNTWLIPYETVQSRQEKFHHPAAFPVDLPRTCIRLHGKPDALVLDPFLGVGTTLVAAELEGARGIGCELDAAYFQASVKRLEAMVGN